MIKKTSKTKSVSFTEAEKKRIKRILEKVGNLKESTEMRILSFEQLFKHFNQAEKSF